MLDAASIVFGERGYVGATTDAIANVAGVSQAYIVRTFGSKEALFTDTATRALDRVAAVFRDTATNLTGSSASRQDELGRAYVELVADRGILLTVMHLFTLGHHPHFGPLAREGMLTIYRILRDEVGFGQEEAEAFLARGMLINTVLGLRLPDHVATEPDARDLMVCIFEGDTDEVVNMFSGQQPLPSSDRGST